MDDSSKALKERLEKIYFLYNRPEYIPPDPLQTILPFKDVEEREIAGLIASSLALGRASCIVDAAESVFAQVAVSGFKNTLLSLKREDFLELFSGFRYRFFSSLEISFFLTALQRVLLDFGSLESCFRSFLKDAYSRSGAVLPILPALSSFIGLIQRYGEGKTGMLLSSPEKKSACKRVFLYLRWMARNDEVDPGGWEIDPSLLIVPIDTHMLKIGRHLGFTRRKQADLASAVEITEAFRALTPEDPVKYDFSLTRLGIRQDLDLESIVSQDADQQPDSRYACR